MNASKSERSNETSSAIASVDDDSTGASDDIRSRELTASNADAAAPVTYAQHLLRIVEGDDKNVSVRTELRAAWVYIGALLEINAQLDRQLAETQKRELQARNYAYHDELTGLPNRRLLRDRLAQTMAQAARHHKQVLLLLLDVDEFKSVNDALGHVAGDTLLQTVASRLKEAIRIGDTACRLGGDEFLIMLPESDRFSSASVLATLRARLNEPYVIDGQVVQCSVSSGAAVYPDDGQTFEELIRHADEALYEAKNLSRPALLSG